MAAALSLTDTEISKVLADVYKGVRQNIFPIMPPLSNRWWEPKVVRSYAYYGFWRCPRCDRHLEGFERKAHEAVHKLRGEKLEPPDDSYTVTWSVKFGSRTRVK